MLKNRILVVDDFYSAGGSEVVARQTSELLKENGFVTYYFFGTELKSNPKTFLEYIYSFEYRKKLTDILLNFKPDFVHIHTYYHILSPSIFYSIKKYRTINPNLKVIFTCHDYHILSPNSGFQFFNWINNKPSLFISPPNNFEILFKKFDQRSIFHSLLKKIQWILNYWILNYHNEIDIFIAPSIFMFNLLNSKFRNKVLLVRNFCDLKIEKNIIPNDYTTDTLRVLKLVFIGRIEVEKGLVNFINCISEVEGIQFDIIGEGSLLPFVDSLIKELDISCKVRLCGKITRSEIEEILPSYDVFVLPSIWYENAPLSIIEAAFKGLTLLVSDLGGSKELAELVGQCILFNPFDKNSILHSINEVKNNNVKVRNAESLEKIYSIFSKATYVDKIKEIVER